MKRAKQRYSKVQTKLEISFAALAIVISALLNQAIIKLLLERTSLEVTMVENGEEAVQRCHDEQFDPIFMDMQMPVITGYEAAEVLRKEGIITPVIALTANAMKGDKQKCLEAGCSEYLTKPIDRDQLRQMIDKFLIFS